MQGYLTGYTYSTDFPTRNAYQPSFGGGTIDGFVTKLESKATLDDLIDLVESFNFQQGISNALDAKLENVQDPLEASNAGLRQDAVNKLEAFINSVEAQRGKEITDEQADELIAITDEILASLTG